MEGQMLDSHITELAEHAQVPLLHANPNHEREEFDFDPAEMVAAVIGNPLPATGVRGLLLAVLEDGIRCYFSPVRRVRNEAEPWVESTMQRSAFSFPVLCELFGLDAGAARRSLRVLRDRFPRTSLPARRRRVVHGGLLA